MKIRPFGPIEIPQTDDINRPEGPYLHAFKDISDVYGAKKSFILTSGATVGIGSMVLYAMKSGYKIAASRNSHMSVINACLAFGADLEIIEPEYHNLSGTYKSPTEAFLDFIEKINGKYALIITSSDYFGRCADIAAIKNAAAAKDCLVLCDEAHGAHYVYSAKLPESAGKYADIWVHGAHKTLNVMTQGALAHCSNDVDCGLFERILTAINTSSPSHLIASQIEDAAGKQSFALWDARAGRCEILQSEINKLKYMKCMDRSWAQAAGYIDKDITRIVIDAKDAGGGFMLYKELYNKFNIQLEMADFRYAVAIMTPNDKKEWDGMLLDALKALDTEKPSSAFPEPPPLSKRAVPMKKAWLKRAKSTLLEDAEGKIAADIIGAYPPGVALILPGEKITAEHINYIKRIKELGGHFFGTDGNDILTAGV
jgi:arginine/lysine/ornithine decarboxylase